MIKLLLFLQLFTIAPNGEYVLETESFGVTQISYLNAKCLVNSPTVECVIEGTDCVDNYYCTVCDFETEDLDTPHSHFK